MTIAKERGDRVAVKKASTTRKTSLYRLRSNGLVAEEDLASFVLARYLDRDGFTSRMVDQDGIRGLLVNGTVAPGTADWCDPLSARVEQRPEVAGRVPRLAYGRPPIGMPRLDRTPNHIEQELQALAAQITQRAVSASV